MKRLDVTGQRFGSLTAVRFTESRNNVSYWLFRCDCGCEKEIALNNVLRGKTKSCGMAGRGHSRSKKGPRRDLTGERFGRLTALYSTGEQASDGSYIWMCRCDCGRSVAVPSSVLLSNRSQSCGCLRRERRNAAFRRDDVRKKHEEISKKYWPNTAEKMGMQDGTNLSIVTQTRPTKNSSTGVRGVFQKRPGEYVASLTFQGITHTKGGFRQVEDAAKERAKMYEKYVVPYLEDSNYEPRQSH